MSIADKTHRILYTEKQIAERVSELGTVISADYKNKNLMIISLLKGSFIFTADLVRAIDQDMRIEFMTTSSYIGKSMESAGEVKIVKDVEGDLSEYDVLIVDDIADSGITLKSVSEHLTNRGVKSIKSCVFLDKPSRRRVKIVPDYIGYEIPDLFIVGYGLNYGDYYRSLPHIYGVED